VRCLVTGATGFLGSYLVRLLLENDCQVAVLMRSASNPWRIREMLPRLTVIPGDLTTIQQSEDDLRAFSPDVVFHLAWNGVGNRFRNEPAQIDWNLFGSLKLLETAREAGCRCWVGLGSQAEYGDHNGVFSESLPDAPNTMYGAVKHCVRLLSERLCHSFDMRFIWMRLFAVYGPGDDPSHLIPYATRSLLQGQRPALTSGEQLWDYLYVEDAASAIWGAANERAAQGVLNLGSGMGRSVRSVVEEIRDLIDPTLDLGFGEVAYGPRQIMHLQADISRLVSTTGWVPRTDLSDGLRRTVAWQRSGQALHMATPKVGFQQ
jgi:UDP-glucose 4-epimerase